MFEFLVACRFPWIELGWSLDNYPKYFNTITGLNWTLDDMWRTADRIYGMIKLNYLREFPGYYTPGGFPACRLVRPVQRGHARADCREGTRVG